MLKSLKRYLKVHAGIQDEVPKKYSQMSIMELFNQLNLWKKPEPVNVYNERIPCLAGYAVMKKYKDFLGASRSFAANRGYHLEDYHILGLFGCTVYTAQLFARSNSILYTVTTRTNLQ